MMPAPSLARPHVLLIGDPPAVDRIFQRLCAWAEVEVIRDPHMRRVGLRKGIDWVLAMNVRGLGERLKAEAKERGIRFTTIPPSWVGTESTLREQGFPFVPAGTPTVMEQFDAADAAAALAAEKEEERTMPETPQTVSIVLHHQRDDTTTVIAAYAHEEHAHQHGAEDDESTDVTVEVISLPIRTEYIPRVPKDQLLEEALALLKKTYDETSAPVEYAALLKRVRRAAEE